MMEIKAALDAAFTAYSDALSTGASEDVALKVGLARYRAFFPHAKTAHRGVSSLVETPPGARQHNSFRPARAGALLCEVDSFLPLGVYTHALSHLARHQWSE
jgi:hypothetical protein